MARSWPDLQAYHDGRVKRKRVIIVERQNGGLTLPWWEGSESDRPNRFWSAEMPTFHVQDMTCGHCVATITRALKDHDADAKVTVDLPRRRVDVVSERLSAAAVAHAIEAAGYTPLAEV